MKKFVIFLISAILATTCVNSYAQTENEGCSFRFVLEDPSGLTGWPPGRGISVTVEGVEYGFINLAWGTFSAEDTLLLPSGEVHFLWLGGPCDPFRCYFEIYNSLDELIFSSPDDNTLPEGLFFTYDNECSVGIASTTLSNQITVYPNPVKDELLITNYELRIMNVEIFDVYGRKQKAKSKSQNGEREVVVNVSNLPAGIYFFNVTTIDGKIGAYKVVVTK